MANPLLTRVALAAAPSVTGSPSATARKGAGRLGGLIAAPLILVVCAVLVVFGARYNQEAAPPSSGAIAPGVGIPAALIPIYEEAARAEHVNAFLLASVHDQETGFSTDASTYAVNGSGCAGPMQISAVPGSPCGCLWCEASVRNAYRAGVRPASYPDERRPHPSIYDNFDAVMAAAVILKGKVGGKEIPNLDDTAHAALCGYYGACSDGIAGNYADDVLNRAKQWQDASARAGFGSALGGTVPDAQGGIGFTAAPGTDFTYNEEPEIARRADAMGRALNLHLTGLSGHRTPEHNAAVGGSTTSQHLTGDAADIDGTQEIPEATLLQYGLHRPIPGTWLGTDGAIHDERDHLVLAPGTVHLAPAGGGTPGGPLQLASGERARILPNGLAAAPADAPQAVKAIIAAGNQINGKPYTYGGGHGIAPTAVGASYDCSAGVSHLLAGAGLLHVTEDSSALMSFGKPGVGRWVTIYSDPGHVYMYVAGIRWDTSGFAGDTSPNAGNGWHSNVRPRRPGDAVRHPEGL
ncbi:MAG TPA: D-Ala-D-Ala carboxypeptidase family metallohydrolase [Conexibacter sp.]|jgi:hypothetical protein